MPQGEDPVALPRGLADADGERGFVRNAQETIDALRLGTGALMWRSGIEAEPLLVVGSRLVAASPSRTRPNGLEIVLLDSDAGGRAIGRDELELPEGISVSLRDRRDFDLAARRVGESLALSWTARTRYRGGAPPPDEVARAARGDLRGRALVDLQTGRVAPGEHAAESTVEPGLPPSHPYRMQSVWREVGWRAGSRILSLSLAGSGEDRTLTVHAAGEGPEDRVAALLAGRRFEVDVTPCGHYVFARTTDPRGDEWVVFEADGGARVTTLGHEDGHQWPCVIGERIYYLSTGGPRPAGRAALILRAADLRTGHPAWEHDLGGPGPGPPALAR
jgi:hypothetical protein